MKVEAKTAAACDQADAGANLSGNPSIGDVIATRFSRRRALFGGGAFATAAALMPAFALTACDSGDDAELNSNPVASAGSPVVTSSGRAVTLRGSGSDKEGAVSGGRWTQLTGPAVTLRADASADTVTFIAPGVSTRTVLTFRFSLQDSAGLDGAADVTVTVEPARLGFQAVAKNLDDRVTVPADYTVTVLYSLGDPILAGAAAYANNGTDTNFAARAGDHHDGMSYFGLAATGSARDDASSTRGLLVMNHENITQFFLHPNGPSPAPRPESEALKEMEAHGVSVVEISRAGVAGAWRYEPAGALNRRVTPLTPMQFNGPAAGNAQLRTLFSPDGTRGRGTINNCANGVTAWGDYLTCEENWAGYFRRDAGDNANRPAKQVTSLNRNGVAQGARGNYNWTTVAPSSASGTIYSRWNATVNPATPADGSGDFRNEPNQFGWVVEIDPYDPASTPRKRTALGRFAHEGCWPSNFAAGRRPVWYMGDDNRGDYIYKFVSDTPWDPADAGRTDRLAVGDKYLDRGTLYVARFDATGQGAWLPLVFGQGPLTPANAAYPFADQADVLINARLAGDALGATRMDRPEWGAVNPVNGEFYMTLTNSNQANRPVSNTNAANPRSYNDPRQPAGGGAPASQLGNPNGHIIRVREGGDNPESTSFAWDIFLFGSDASLDPANINISGLDDSNEFSSPDGLWFSRPTNPAGQVNPLLWIQTDDGALTDKTNNQMLAAMPGVVGDGGARTVVNTDGTGSRSQGTFVGKPLGMMLRRFLTGPKDSEITGIDSTPDGRTIFVNIQHPGEDSGPAGNTSNWPSNQSNPGATARPRSSTIVITKNDGGVVGL